MQAIDERIEQRGLWWVFHKHLIVEMFEQLRDQLGDAYLVDFESDLLLIPRLDGPSRPVTADVDVTLLAPAVATYTPAALAPTPALLEADEALDEIEQRSIEVRRRDMPDPDDVFGSRVVAVIELLSPSNKGVYGAADRRKFLAKRRGYLSGPVSYIEIDLLREGERDLPRAVERLSQSPYLVWASQAQPRTRHHWGWGWGTADPLPAITLPLEYPHIHVFDLADCYARAHQRNRWPVRLSFD